jgi:hypothetical protein
LIASFKEEFPQEMIESMPPNENSFSVPFQNFTEITLHQSHKIILSNMSEFHCESTFFPFQTLTHSLSHSPSHFLILCLPFWLSVSDYPQNQRHSRLFHLKFKPNINIDQLLVVMIHHQSDVGLFILTSIHSFTMCDLDLAPNGARSPLKVL